MHYQITILLNNREQTLQIFSENFKNLTVWKIRFQHEREAVLFKCEGIWMQRNEDELDDNTINLIGEQIDRVNLNLGHSKRLNPLSA